MTTYDMTMDYSKEWIPSQLLVCLRMALLADKSEVTVLPKFEGFTRQLMRVTVKVTTNPITLRSIIGKRHIMLKRGQAIITSLLRGLKELRGPRYVVRSIQPSSITLTDQDFDLKFSDISQMCIDEEERTREVGSFSPYNGLKVDEEEYLDNASPELDYWSVGVVILEILAGTELVITATSASKIRDLLRLCEQHLDSSTVSLLKHLLFGANEDYLEVYLEEVLTKKPNIVAEGIRALDAALDEEKELQKWSLAYQLLQQAEPALVRDRYGI